MVGVTVHAAQEEIDAEVGHEDGEESQDHEEMEVARTSEPRETLGVEGKTIDQEGDECPYLFGIPTPLSTPRDIGPDGADEDACRHAEEGRIEQEASHIGQLEVDLLAALRVATDKEGQEQRGESVEESERQQRVGHHDDADVAGEQRGGEHRHERSDLRVALTHHRHEQCETRQEESEGHDEDEATTRQEGDDQGDEGEELHGLVPVGERQVSRYVPS